jgi:hypothetical protein
VKLGFDLDALGYGTIMLDGVDVSANLTKLELVAEVGTPTRIKLSLGGVDIDAEAEAAEVTP